MKKKPTAILVGCEGKTESIYLEIIKKVYGAYGLEVRPSAGELFSLIDNMSTIRDNYAAELGVDKEEIETWVTCDDDSRGVKYKELKDYAVNNNILLAYSRPQFEIFLLQHFGQYKEGKQKRVLDDINEIVKKYSKEKYNKTNLAWLEEEIFAKPSLIDIAITNSDIRKKSSEKVFITFQNLIKSIKNVYYQ